MNDWESWPIVGGATATLPEEEPPVEEATADVSDWRTWPVVGGSAPEAASASPEPNTFEQDYDAAMAFAERAQQPPSDEELLATEPTASLPPLVRGAVSGLLDIADTGQQLVRNVLGDRAGAEKLKEDKERRAMASDARKRNPFFTDNLSGPVAGALKAGESTAEFFDPVAKVLTESVAVGAVGGVPGVAGYYAGSTFQDKMQETGDPVYSAIAGAIEGGMTLLGGKVLGAGAGQLASKVNLFGEGGGSWLGKLAGRAMERSGLNKKLKAIAPALGGGAAETTEELATTALHAWNDYSFGGNDKAFDNLWDQLVETAKVAGPAGLIGGGIASAGRRNKIADSLKSAADEMKSGLKGVQAAVEDIEAVQTPSTSENVAEQNVGTSTEVPTQPIPVPPASRHGFAKATGRQRTSEAERQGYIDTVEEYNRIAAANDVLLEEAAPEVEPPHKEYTASNRRAIRSEALRWIGRTEDSGERYANRRKKKLPDASLVEEIDKLLPEQPHLVEEILLASEDFYARETETQRDKRNYLDTLIQEAVPNYKSFSDRVKRIHKRGGDNDAYKGFDLIVDAINAQVGGTDQAISPDDVWEHVLYRGGIETYGKRRAMVEAINAVGEKYGLFQETPNEEVPTETSPAPQAEGEVDQFPDTGNMVAPPTTAPSVAPESPPPAEATVQPDTVEVRPEAAEALPGALHDAIPGARLQERSPGQYQVDLPNGRFFTLELAPEIKSRSQKYAKFLLNVNGLEDTPENRKRIRNKGGIGRFTIGTPEGELIDGLGVMKVLDKLEAPRMASTIRHEAVHVARAFGLFSDQEWDALVAEHSDTSRSAKRQEEDIAKASKAWGGKQGLSQRIKDLLNRFLAFLRLTPLSASNAQRSLTSGAVFTREGKRNKNAVADAAMESQDALSMEQLPELVDNYRKPLSHYTPKLYRETNLGDLLFLLPGASTSTDLSRDSLFFSNKPELALGQGKNRGVVAEFDSDSIEGQVSKRKPSWEFSYQQGDAEFTAINPTGTYQKSLRAFTVAADASSDRATKLRVQKELQRLEQAGWTKTQVEGGVRYERPDTIASMEQQDEELFDKGAPPDDRYLGRATPIASQPQRHEFYKQAVELGPPKHRGREAAVKEATALIKQDYNGQLAKWLAASERSRQAGGLSIHESETDAAVVRSLAFSELTKGLRGDKQAYANSKLLSQYGWIDARSEEARIHSMRDPLGNTAIARQEALLATFSEMTGQDRAIDATKELLEDSRKTLPPELVNEYLKIAGLDMDKLTWDEIAASVPLTLRAMNVFHQLSASKSSYVLELFRNNIMSSIKTLIVNAGGASYGLYRTLGERLVAGTINAAMRRKRGPQLGEMQHVLAGMLPGVIRGMRVAAVAWKYEIPALEIELGRLTHEQIIGKEGMLRGAIPGRTGKAIRTMAFRPTSATDQFFRALLYEMEVAGLAYRKGKSQGKADEELGRFMAAETADPLSDSAIEAYLEAKHGTFQGKPGIVASGIGQTVDALRNTPGLRKFQGGHFVTPFKDTPANAFEQAAKRLPIFGLAVDALNLRRRKRLKPEERAEAEQVDLSDVMARQLIALVGLAVVIGSNDPDDPWLTGTYDEDTAYRPPPPQSIWIPGYGWLSYSRLEPFSTVLATTVDMSNTYHTGKNPLTEIRDSIGRQITDKAYLDTISDLAALAQGLAGNKQKMEEGMKLPGNIAVGLTVPNLLRDANKSIRNVTPERDAWGKGGDWWKHYGKRLAQDAGFYPMTPKVDIMGRDITPYSDKSTFFYRLLSPMRSKSTEDVTPFEEAIYAWNMRHSEDEAYTISAPDKHWKDGKDSKFLSDEQYEVRARYTGKLIRSHLEEVLAVKKDPWKLNPLKPTQDDIDLMKRIIGRAKTLATKDLKPYWQSGETGAELLKP